MRYGLIIYLPMLMALLMGCQGRKHEQLQDLILEEQSAEEQNSVLGFGLLDHQFSIIYPEDAQNVCIVKIPYDEMYPNLSSEAQK